MKKAVSIFILVCFITTGQIGVYPVYAQDFVLPKPGAMIHLSPEFNPPILKGIKVHPDNPFRFDFILDQGDSSVIPTSSTVIPAKAGIQNQEKLKQQATRLITYFLASLTIPEKDLWVNLSPYEKDRIVPEFFGQTEMGRDLLAEDYMLKQITASLIYPEDEIGKKFWKRIYEEAAKKFGTTNIPVNTFNKVWIVPEKAVVYENAKAGTAYVVEAKLKVMLEQDYLVLSHNVIPAFSTVIPAKAGIQNKNDINALGSKIVRQIVIPELTKEVNENKNFAQLRQVYNSLILATWYKKKIKDSILSQVYADKNKTAGVQYTASIIPKSSTVIPAKAGIQNRINSDMDPRRTIVSVRYEDVRGDDNKKDDVDLIYQRYLQAFKKGVYNYIKEDLDPVTQETIPRKYFSGGFDMAMSSNGLLHISVNPDMAAAALIAKNQDLLIEAKLEITNRAMSAIAVAADRSHGDRPQDFIKRISRSIANIRSDTMYATVIKDASMITRVDNFPFKRIPQRGKWAIDLVLASIFFLVSSPILVLISIFIKLDSPGPVIYRSVRIGLNGKEFVIYKFRTMVEGADSEVERLIRENVLNSRTLAITKNKKDPRVTKIGEFLRKYHLDELPQLFNVLKGNMSLVGPRPWVFGQSSLVSRQNKRWQVLPGITGWAQIKGSYGNLEQSVELDEYYVNNWSLVLDIRILIKTIIHIIGHKAKIGKIGDSVKNAVIETVPDAQLAGAMNAPASNPPKGITWAELERQGYSYEIKDELGPAAVSKQIELYRNGELQSKDIHLLIFPQQKVCGFSWFFPNFPKPITEEDKVGRGRALLTEILRFEHLQGYYFYAKGSPGLISSLMKLTEFSPEYGANSSLFLNKGGEYRKFADRILAELPAGQVRALLLRIFYSSNFWGKVPEYYASVTTPGGIDLTSANMNLQTKMDSRFRGNDSGGFGDDKQGIKFYLDSATLEQLQNAPGFVPVIISVQPMTDLRKFLGIASLRSQ